MNKKNIAIICMIGILFIILISPLVCFSQTNDIYHNQEGHFSFAVPDGWTESSKGELAEFTKAMNQLPGTKQELTSVFYNTEKPSTYMLLKIKKSGRTSERNIQKMVSDGSLDKLSQNRADILKNYGDLKFNKSTYDDKKHILYMKIEQLSGTEKVSGVVAAILSNYGTVQIAFYSLTEDFDTDINYFNQVMDSFNFDKGYEYINLKEERNWTMFGILPKSLSAWMLLLMAIYLYGKHSNWKKFKETKIYFIKEATAIVLAVIVNQVIDVLHSLDISSNFKDTPDVILAIAVGIFWYYEYKKINKREPLADKISNENLKKGMLLKVSPKDGYWSCPSCHENNKELQDVCSNCGQEIEKLKFTLNKEQK